MILRPRKRVLLADARWADRIRVLMSLINSQLRAASNGAGRNYAPRPRLRRHEAWVNL